MNAEEAELTTLVASRRIQGTKTKRIQTASTY